MSQEIDLRLYKKHRDGAAFRITACLMMWVVSAVAYHFDALGKHSFYGISGSVGYLILINPIILWDVSRSRNPRLLEYISILTNFLEVVGYTAIIHFVGGVEASFLTPIYCVLIAYLGMVAPRRFSFIIAGWCAVSFSLMVMMEHLGWLIHHNPFNNTPSGFQPPAVNQAFIVVLVNALLFMVAYVSAESSNRLRTARRKLREQNAELERRVEKRTSELVEINRKMQEEIERRKTAAYALKNSEEKYRTILESIEEGYYELDLDGRFTFFNDALCRILAREPEEIMKLQSRRLMDADELESISAIYRDVLETGVSANINEWKLLRKNGETRFIESSVSLIRDPDGEPAGYRGIVRDVTERKTIENELISTRDFLQNILNSSIDGITTTDRRGVVLYTAPNIKQLLGFEQDDLIGRKIHSFYEKGLEEAKRIMKALAEHGELNNHEMRMICKDGSFLDVSLSASLFKDQHGAALGTLGVFRDIREKKKLEAQFQYAQKIEAVGTLAGGLAHDFNNLLMGIKGNASLMLRGCGPDHQFYNGLANIEKIVDSGARLTAQLLGYARKGRYEVKPLDLIQLVADTAETFGRTRKEITVETVFEPGLSLVEADPGQLEQVLYNLFVNAADAMPDGGLLKIIAENAMHMDIENELYSPNPGRYVKITVSDNGTGISPEILKRIFDPFFTTKEMGRGTGLGLAAAYGIIKAHSGYIHAKSEAGRGSDFIIYLPATDKPLQAHAELPARLEKGVEAILLVDDEEMILDVGSEFLKELGYKVYAASDGAGAIKIYSERKDEIDMVILDMIMPGMSGSEIYDRLKKINPEIKVLLSSGYSVEGQAREILERGCNGFMQKPFSLEQMSMKIREILDN